MSEDAAALRNSKDAYVMCKLHYELSYGRAA